MKCVLMKPDAISRCVCPTYQPVAFHMGINLWWLVCLAIERKILRTKAG